MGWNTANEIFDPVAEQVSKAVSDGYFSRDESVAVLQTLINVLKGEDWDTWDESLERFKGHAVVVTAFQESEKRWLS